MYEFIKKSCLPSTTVAELNTVAFTFKARLCLQWLQLACLLALCRQTALWSQKQ